MPQGPCVTPEPGKDKYVSQRPPATAPFSKIPSLVATRVTGLLPLRAHSFHSCCPRPPEHSPCCLPPHLERSSLPIPQLLPQLPDPGICLLFICSDPGNVGQSRDWGYIPQTQVRDVGQGLQGSKNHQKIFTDIMRRPSDCKTHGEGHLIQHWVPGWPPRESRGQFLVGNSLNKRSGEFVGLQIVHSWTEPGVAGGLQEAGKGIRNFDSKTNNEPLEDFKNRF